MFEATPPPTSWTALAWITITALAGVAVVLGALYRATMEGRVKSLEAHLAAKDKRIADLEAAATLREERHGADKAAQAERHQAAQATWMERMHSGLMAANDLVERVYEHLKEFSRRLP